MADVSQAMHLPLPGQRFAHRYEIEEVLGRGGFATVYRGVDVEIGRSVALKVLMPNMEGHYASNVESRFMREARVLAGLHDPHTITMFDFGRSPEGLLYMVFEYLEGSDLSEHLRAGPLPEQDVVHILRQVLHALREAHARGVLHRDIKPGNILIYRYMGDERRAKLLDFGIAQPTLQPSSDPLISITAAGAAVGTVRYMAPEQVVGGALTPAADLYSLGLVAFEMLVGRPAIPGSSTKETLQMQLSDAPLRLPATASVSVSLRRTVEWMTAREAAARPQSAEAVLEALELPPERGSPSPADENERRELGRRQRLVILAAASLALAIVGGVVAVSLLSDDAPPRRVARPTVEPAPVARSAAEVPASPEVVETTPPPPVEPGVDAADVQDVGNEVVLTGCGIEPGRRGDHSFVASIGSERTWVTYLPRSYDPEQRYPVLLMFHDHTRSAMQILADTALRSNADEEGILLVALDAERTDRPWRSGHDISFVNHVLDETERTFCVDTRRIFALGHNIGGRFAESLPCHIPLSGIASTGYREARDARPCTPDPPVPFIHLEGVHNRYYPVGGGIGCAGVDVVPLAEKERVWWERNECRGEREVWLQHGGGTCFTKQCEGPPFVSCHLDGGRDWPNAGPRVIELPMCKVPAADFPFGETILRFFREHGRDRQ